MIALPHAPKVKGLDLPKFCRGRSISANVGVQKFELKFDDLATMPFEARVCAYYDYRRQYRIASLQRQTRLTFH
jgi:hypothetical protein